MPFSRPGRFSRRRSLCPKKTADLGSIGTVGIYEPGVFPEEDERDFPGGAVPVLQAGNFTPGMITLTRRRTHLLEEYKAMGFEVTSDNPAAVKGADVVIVAVEPQRVDTLLQEIAPALDFDRHILISVVTGLAIKRIEEVIGKPLRIARAMPNTAIAVRESMTCLASNGPDDRALEMAKRIFNDVGKTLRIREEDMIAATALGACGIAFFLRAIRAASQGGSKSACRPRTHWPWRSRRPRAPPACSP